MSFVIEEVPVIGVLPDKGKEKLILEKVRGSFKMEHRPDEWEEDLCCVYPGKVLDTAFYMARPLDMEYMMLSLRVDESEELVSWLHVPGSKEWAIDNEIFDGTVSRPLGEVDPNPPTTGPTPTL